MIQCLLVLCQQITLEGGHRLVRFNPWKRPSASSSVSHEGFWMTHSFKPTSITGWKDWYKYINRTNFCLIINCFAMYIYIYCGSARLIHKSTLKMKLVFILDSLRSVLETTTAFVLVCCFLSEISFSLVHPQGGSVAAYRRVRRASLPALSSSVLPCWSWQMGCTLCSGLFLKHRL